MARIAPVGRVGEALLRLCADPDREGPPSLWDLRPDDWTALASRAADLRIAPLAARALDNAPARTVLPAAARDRLESAARWHKVHALRQAAALGPLARLLADEGHQPLMLKGVGLAFGIYPEPSLRPMRDVDLLLPPPSAHAVQQLLLRHPRYRIHPAVRGMRRTSPDHYLPLQDTALGLTIEVHHRIGDPAMFPQGEGLAEALRDRPRRLAIGERALMVPRPETNLLHMVAAAVVKDRLHGGPLILADLHYLAATSPDWDEIWTLAGELRLQRGLGLLCAVARRNGASWVPKILDPAADFALPFADAAERALLVPSDTAARGKIVDRVARHKASGGSALWLAFAPEPAQLAQAIGVDPQSRWRWSGYPVWLVQRSAQYVLARLSGGNRATGPSGRLGRWIDGG